MQIVLIGPPGAGKSTLGKRVARILGRGFADTDRSFETRHGQIAAFFTEFGEREFRRLERETVREVLESAAGVIAFGGGAVLDEQTQLALATRHVIFVDFHPEKSTRQVSTAHRPLLSDDGAWRALYEQRRALYEQLASQTIDASNGSVPRLAHKIVKSLPKSLQGGRPNTKANMGSR